MYLLLYHFIFFFFNDTATTEIYTLSLHDALPIWDDSPSRMGACGAASSSFRATYRWRRPRGPCWNETRHGDRDRKSTRLNSSHSQISYAVFCLKKKKKNKTH